MNFSLLFENITNPALLFFLVGILAVQVKSDLSIPPNSSKFISLYLLFSIGFKGGQELAHSTFNSEIYLSLILGIGLAALIPIYVFFFTKKKFGEMNAGAIAASYGSVSAVTFITSISYLELNNISYGGHMVAVMALMEAPAIIVGLLLISLFSKNKSEKPSVKKAFFHSISNGSVLLISASLVIGFIASEKQAQGIAPFTTDIFKGFLIIFLLDMGITCGKKLRGLLKHGVSPFVMAVVFPLLNGALVAIGTGFVLEGDGNRFLFAILAAGASYIAVPAAMRLAVPKANPSLYLSMALGITFPLNITLGIPFYYFLIQLFP